MVEKEEPVAIRPFNKHDERDLVTISEIEVEAQRIPIRIFRRNAYNESQILEEKIVRTTDEYIRLLTLKSRAVLDKAAHYAGIIILLSVVVTCIWIILIPSTSSQLDNATKMLFLVIGAVLGTLFPNSRENKD
jgi:hypothetical protein